MTKSWKDLAVELAKGCRAASEPYPLDTGCGNSRDDHNSDACSGCQKAAKERDDAINVIWRARARVKNLTAQILSRTKKGSKS